MLAARRRAGSQCFSPFSRQLALRCPSQKVALDPHLARRLSWYWGPCVKQVAEGGLLETNSSNLVPCFGATTQGKLGKTSYQKRGEEGEGGVFNAAQVNDVIYANRSLLFREINLQRAFPNRLTAHGPECNATPGDLTYAFYLRVHPILFYFLLR